MILFKTSFFWISLKLQNNITKINVSTLYFLYMFLKYVSILHVSLDKRHFLNDAQAIWIS